jgi:hypothetical protein
MNEYPLPGNVEWTGGVTAFVQTMSPYTEASGAQWRGGIF